VELGLSGNLLNDLGRAIASGEYPAGHVLITTAFGEQHKASRTAARDAMRVLESMRMVTSTRGVGIRVQPVTEWNLYDPRVIRWRLDVGDREEQLRLLTELRTGVEPIAAGLAAKRATRVGPS
jgi:DNA-binding FadR family transcriptional regulator